MFQAVLRLRQDIPVRRWASRHVRKHKARRGISCDVLGILKLFFGISKTTSPGISCVSSQTANIRYNSDIVFHILSLSYKYGPWKSALLSAWRARLKTRDSRLKTRRGDFILDVVQDTIKLVQQNPVSEAPNNLNPTQACPSPIHPDSIHNPSPCPSRSRSSCIPDCDGNAAALAERCGRTSRPPLCWTD